MLRANSTLMKTLIYSLVVLLFQSTLLGQASNDHWDRTFNPKIAEEKQKKRILDWYKSWSGRLCLESDVKGYWRLTLLTPRPGTLDPKLREIDRRNAEINKAIDSGAWDYEAQDLADQLNILFLSSNKRDAEAIALQQIRAQRQAARQQEILNKRLLRLEHEAARLNDEIRYLNDTLSTTGRAIFR